MLPPSAEPMRFPRVAFYAGLTTLLAGVVVLAAGVQVLLVVTFYNALGWVPWAMIALGALSVPTGGALTNARLWACWASVLCMSLAAVGCFAWGVYGLLNGLFALTPFFGALISALGGALALAAVAPVRRYSAWQAELFAAEPESAAGPVPASTPYPAPPRARPWPLLVSIGVVALFTVALLGALHSPEVAERVLVQAHLLVTGRIPPRADGFVETREDYAYPGSPFLEYLAYEGRFLTIDASRASEFADAIAAEVGWSMLAESGEATVGEAERALWEEGKAQQIPLWIARALRSRGAFYYPESLLSRSFDPELHLDEDLVHLDCDQLAHLFAHVAWRLDLDIREVQSPMHVYLQYLPPEGVSADLLTIEATNFRQVDVAGNHVDFMGEGIGEEYFIEPDHHASGRSGTYASEELVAAAGLYEHATARDLSDMIVANVIVGLHEHEIEAPYLDELRARLDGTRSYVLVSNLHTWTVEKAQDALDLGEPALAIEAAREALEIRALHPSLVLLRDPQDRLLLVRGLIGKGDEDAARAELSGMLHDLELRFGLERPFTAQTMTQSEGLVLSVELDPPSSAADCDARLGAVLRLESQLESGRRRWAEPACALASQAGARCADALAICASLR